MILFITILNTEYWKPVIGYEGYYEVSSLGRIRSIERRNSRGEILKPFLNKTGYLSISLSKDGTAKTHRLHKLIAMAFLSNLENFPCVNHKNEVKSDNRVENLEWCSIRYNTLYGCGISKMIKTRLKNTKPIFAYSENRNVVFRFVNMTDVTLHGFHRGKVWECITGKRRKYRNLYWRR